jgi:hypothetical protein
MYTTWLTAQYLAELTRRRLRAVSSDRGALSLEWVVIAVALVAAAGVAAVLFTRAIRAEAGKLP